MNKFYETANIISVFFVMPILIFLSYQARTPSSKADVIGQEQVQQSLQTPLLAPEPQKNNADISSEATPDPMPVPENNLTPNKRSTKRSVQQQQPYPSGRKPVMGRACPSAGCGAAGCGAAERGTYNVQVYESQTNLYGYYPGR